MATDPSDARHAEAHALKDEAREAVAEMKEEVRHTAETVRSQMHSSASRQKGMAAEQIAGWAQALRTASDELQSRGQDTSAACVRQASAGLERASGTVRDRSVDDLIGTVEDFARRQPMAFFGGAVVAGFGIARFMKSSADRRLSMPGEVGGNPIREGGER